MSWQKTLVLVIAVSLAVVAVLVVADPPAAADPVRPDSAWFAGLTPSQQRDSIVADEARRAGVPPRLAIAVSHTENWTGDSGAISSAGAVGLMQVRPQLWQHAFEAACGCGSLFVRRVNACKGVRVLKLYLDSLPSVDVALRAYHGSNKPRLHQAGDVYVGTVLDRLAFPRDGTQVVP